MPGTDKDSQQAVEEKARLLDLANDAILVRDASDRITFWNNGATAMYGFSREKAIGRVSHDLLSTEFPEPLQSIREKLLREGQWSGELRHVCATGTTKVVSTRWVLERDESGSISHNLRVAVIDAAGKLQKIYTGNEWSVDGLTAEMIKAAAARP